MIKRVEDAIEYSISKRVTVQAKDKFKDFDMDSLDVIDMVIYLEKELHMEIDEEINQDYTVSQLIEVIERKLNG